MQFLKNLQTADLIALLVICGILLANYRGADFMLPQSGLLILGYYFGHRAAKANNKNATA